MRYKSMVQSSVESVESSLTAQALTSLMLALSEERYRYLRDAPGVDPFDGAKLSAWALDRTIGSTREDRQDVSVVWLILGLAVASDIYVDDDDIAIDLIMAAAARRDHEAMLSMDEPAQTEDAQWALV